MKPLLLDELPESWSLPQGHPFHRKQLVQWLYEKRANSFDQMSNLPKAWRESLAERYDLEPLRCQHVQGSADTTQKFLWALRAGDYVESVLIPATVGDWGNRSERHTLCISTQVGCAYGCKFCASGLDGWKRNLTPAEIVGQIMEAERLSGKHVQNLVFMGMGEPLANFDHLLTSIEIINAPWGLNIGARHITISTSGVVPKIRELAQHPKQLRLALSLHGATDDVRSQIMPVNRRYPIAELMDACREFISHKNKMITFEYILIEGINDMTEQAVLLAKLSKSMKAKVNLIPYNKVEGLDWKRPEREVIENFHQTLLQAGAKATLRLEKGHDIDAACGQLRLKQITPPPPAESPSANP